MDYCMIYVTFANKMEAEKIAQTLLQEKLIACANIMPEMTSYYTWNAQQEKAVEIPCIFKTQQAFYYKIEKRIKELHSYETPCIVCLPIYCGSSDFLTWIDNSLK
ncbi:divalent-cation tolerance protein CutA [Desulfovibrio litoralis]|uniref:Divalent cation tolerance protein n=1 Tax=Desulfovibrio litoralis DSM 11393 TaxID=1121455 RepID=A0A1M7S830_9BACT|nr:divalent-cation tolerance protein CutA [Desulfovibrio litoralis]SHN54482.1 divalent cation tolerance protein [Desulfovibrio litoralis DSM 11393]